MTRVLIALGLVSLLADAAEACPFCARQNDAGKTVYYIATALMLLLPLVLVGGLVWWIRASRRASSEPGDRR